jgi:hypothetical protein
MSDAVVRDRGYQAYDGPRLPGRAALVLGTHTARRLIARKAVRRLLTLAWLAAIITGVIMYVERRVGGTATGGRQPLALLHQPFGVLLPVLFTAVIAAGGTLAEDRRIGALSFYFARPVRPIDYLVGRLGGIFAVLAAIAVAPPTAAALYRVAQADSATEALRSLGVAATVAVLGALLAAIASIYALLGGALAGSRGGAQAFVGAVFALPWIFAGVGASVLGGPWVSLLSLPQLITSAGEPLVELLAGGQRGLDELFLGGVRAADPRLPPLVALGALVTIAIGGLIWLHARIQQLGGAGGDLGGSG